LESLSIVETTHARREQSRRELQRPRGSEAFSLGLMLRIAIRAQPFDFAYLANRDFTFVDESQVSPR
jgi:hypothetical protein